MRDAAQARADALRSPVRRRIVSVITAADDDGGLDASEIADHVGLHVTTVRWHLDRLEAAEVVTGHSERAGNAGRPRKVYRTIEHDTEDTDRDHQSLYLLTGLLTKMVAERTDDHLLTPEEAGEQWARTHVPVDGQGEPAASAGEWIGKIGNLTDVLIEWGYNPEISTNGQIGNAEVRLAHCPFRDLARANPAVVCGIHRGLIRGTMQRLGENGTEVDLLPFADGDVCIAHLHNQELPGHESKES